MKGISKAALTLLWIIFLSSIVSNECGFTYGAPCSIRNTVNLYSTYYTPAQSNQCIQLHVAPHNLKAGQTFVRTLVANATTLYADHIAITKVPTALLKAMPHVELVDLSNNRIRKLQSVAFKHNRFLDVLVLKSNRMKADADAPLLHSQSLTSLQLSDNKIRNVYWITFSQLPNLKYLFLDGNNLDFLEKDSLKPLQALQYLNLNDNKIVTLPPVTMLPNRLQLVLFQGKNINATSLRFFTDPAFHDF